MNLLKKNSWLILILLVNLVIVLYPTFATNLPITQTDGLTYFGVARELAETGDFFAELPDYLPVKGDEATHINEFLPVPILYLAAFIKLFGERIVVNGGALGFLFVLTNLYLYLFVEKLTSKKVALITTLFSVLNFRFYFLLWGGNWSNVFAMMLGVPTLYYYLKYLSDKKMQDLVIASVFLLLTAGSHTMHFLFVATLMIGLWFGVKVMKNTDVKMPKIDFDFKKPDKGTYKALLITVGVAIVAFFVTFIPFVLAGTRTKWVAEWISYLKSFDKVPQFWHYGILADGPIIMALSIFGLFYVFYKQNWKILGVALTSYVIANMTKFLVPDDIWLSLFIYRYQAFHFVMMALLAGYAVFEVLKTHKILKKPLIALIVISLTWQAVKIGAMIHEIEPAITEDELIASQYMLEIQEDFWLVANVNTYSSFRSDEWIFAYADGNGRNRSEGLNDSFLEYPYIMIQDATLLSEEEQAIFSSKELVLQQGVVVIYKN